LILDQDESVAHDGRMTITAAATSTTYVPRRRLAWLALGTFALGTESLVIGGVLPSIADDLDTSLATAGLLVSVFAITYAVSAPVMGLLLSRFAPKAVLVTSMSLFVIANLAAAVAPTIATLMIARVAAAITASMYTPNASAMAGSLSHPDERGRSLALVYMGLSMATMFGVPLGTLVADLGSWRTTFLFVAVLGVAATAGVAHFLPAAPRRPPVTLANWAAVFTNRGVVRVLAVTTVFFAAQFAAFTYVAETIGAVTGWSYAVPAGLLLFGAFGFVGNTMSGRLTDTWGPARTSRTAIVLMGTALAAFTPIVAAGPSPLAIIAAIAAISVWGLGGWGLVPAQQIRLLAAAPNVGPTVLAANSSALYLGTALGGVIGSLTLSTAGLTWIGLVAAAITVVALALNPRTA
jgi:predicted MFS family arabinose efflux permease